MLNITRRHVRFGCLAMVVLYIATFILNWTAHLAAQHDSYVWAVASGAIMLRYHGFFIPVWVLNTVTYLYLIVFAFGLIGTYMFKRWGRSLLAFSLAMSFMIVPLRGEVVYSPASVIAMSIVGMLHIWLLTLMYWSPISREFDVTTSSAIS